MFEVRRARAMRTLAAVLAGFSLACEREAPPSPSGRALYLRHCASCHGESGRGNGPVAASLSVPPTDLTGIARRAGGRFEEARVMRVIDGRREVEAHGPREMPVWGAVFSEQQAGEGWPGYTSLLHARALTDHVRSIQEP